MVGYALSKLSLPLFLLVLFYYVKSAYSGFFHLHSQLAIS